jgi:hypothetical protein
MDDQQKPCIKRKHYKYEHAEIALKATQKKSSHRLHIYTCNKCTPKCFHVGRKFPAGSRGGRKHNGKTQRAS